MNEVIFKPCNVDDVGQITDKIGFLKKEEDADKIQEELSNTIDYSEIYLNDSERNLYTKTESLSLS